MLRNPIYSLKSNSKVSRNRMDLWTVTTNFFYVQRKKKAVSIEIFNLSETWRICNLYTTRNIFKPIEFTTYSKRGKVKFGYKLEDFELNKKDRYNVDVSFALAGEGGGRGDWQFICRVRLENH